MKRIVGIGLSNNARPPTLTTVVSTNSARATPPTIAKPCAMACMGGLLAVLADKLFGVIEHLLAVAAGLTHLGNPLIGQWCG